MRFPVELSRRLLLKTAASLCGGCVAPVVQRAPEPISSPATHFVTLSFDDGFSHSMQLVAKIYEAYNLKACINVLAGVGKPDFETADPYLQGAQLGTFSLWNNLQSRGHEIMPHGYNHSRKTSLPLSQAQQLITKTLDVFSKELKGFAAPQAIFNFPYNDSTPDLEQWLAPQVRAFRVSGNNRATNPMPCTQRLICKSFGPGNIDAWVDAEVTTFLDGPPGWLLLNTHGLDNEGWGPMSSTFLEALLDKLSTIRSVAVVTPSVALNESDLRKTQVTS
jgi:peptidoglycan/xylan/chitin deacetylase (PgdA/CDA1 family)